MQQIHTSLNCLDAALNGKLTLRPNAAFSGVNTLALLIGMADPTTRQLPTDHEGLKAVAYRLDYLMSDCLDGLQGIGAALSAVQLEGMPEEGLNALGRLITNVAALADEVTEHRERLASDPRFPGLWL